MGHAGSDGIDQLSSNVIGIQSPTGSAPSTINCEECLRISRRTGHELGTSRLFEAVAIDIIKLDAIMAIDTYTMDLISTPS
jgi:hypothetical protein